VVYKMAQTFVVYTPGVALKKGNTPAIGVVVGLPAALGKAAKAEGHIGRGIAVHAQQLAHGSVAWFRPQLAARGPVLALDVGDDDIDRASHAAQNLNADARDLGDQFLFLLDGAAFQHFDVVSGHEISFRGDGGLVVGVG